MPPEYRKTSYGRPIVPPRPAALDALLFVGTFAGVAAGIVLVAVSWPQLPERIPTHFGVSGQPNAYGDKGILLALPPLGAVLGLGTWFLSRFPHIFNFPWRVTDANAARQYRLAQRLLRVLAFSIVWMLAYVIWQTVEVGLGGAAGFSPWFLLILLGIILGSLVVYVVAAALAR